MFPLFRLRGHRTYIVAFVMAFMTFAKAVGWIDEETHQAFMGFLIAAGFGTLRAGIRRCE